MVCSRRYTSRARKGLGWKTAIQWMTLSTERRMALNVYLWADHSVRLLILQSLKGAKSTLALQKTSDATTLPVANDELQEINGPHLVFARPS